MADEKKLERIYNVNLTKAYEYTRTRRTLRTVKLLREFLARNFRVETDKVKLSEPLNTYLWRDSIEKPPRHVKVRGVKENGEVKAYLHDEQEIKAAKEQKKKKKDDAKKAKPVKKKDTPAQKPAKETSASNEAKKEEKKK